MKTETYTVTKHAGPKVAGIPAKAGEELQLTEGQARGELLACAIVKGGKDSKDTKDADPLKASEAVADIRARAQGMEKAPKEAPAAEEKPADPPATAKQTTGAQRPVDGAAS